MNNKANNLHFNLRWLVIALAALCTNYSRAETPLELASLDTVVNAIYNFRFNKARELAQNAEIAETYKVLPFAYAHYWEYLSGNEPDFNLKTCNTYLKYKPTPDISDSLYAVYRVSVNLLQLRVHISRSNYLAPLLLFDDIKYFFTNIEPDYNSDFSMLYWGLYNYYISFAREHSFASRFVMNNWPESSKLSGIVMLEKLTKSPSVFVRTESAYFLMRIFLEGEKNFEKASHYAKVLMQSFPDNYIYKWFHLQTIFAMNQNQELESARETYLHQLNDSHKLTQQQKAHFKKLLFNL